MQFLDLLPDCVIDLAIVDPPYNIKVAKWDTFPSEKAYFDFTYQWIDKLIPKLKSTASIYLFNTPLNNAIILNYLINKGLKYRNWIIWYKKDGFSPSKKRYVNNQESVLFLTVSDLYKFNADDVRVPYLSSSRIAHATKKGILKNGKRWFPNPKGKYCSDVWEYSSVRHTTKVNGRVKKQIHPTMKPVDMIKRMILASSGVSDLVLDLFSGMGTTSKACIELNRNFVGCENNSEYFEQIKENINGTCIEQI